jgi:hypothetical protein
MKITTITKIYLPIAAMMLTGALAITAVAQGLTPFKGAIQGNDTDGVLSFPVLPVTTTGGGTGTHLGDFSFTQRSAINVLNGTATGSTHWIAANGDTIETTFTASGAPTDAPPVCPGLGDTYFRVTEIHTITGGTGRFAGVQGSFRVERQASPVTFKTCGSYQGTITSPGGTN